MSWDCEYTIPPGTTIRGVAQRLRNLTPCKIDRPRTVERTFLDTFDWRLYARAHVLEQWRFNNGSITLQIRRLNQTETTGSARLESTARFIRDLPAGTVRTRLGALVQMRALLPAVRIHSRIDTLRIVDKNQKTVTFLELENSKILDGSRDRTGTEFQRARIVPVRGYAKAARNLSRLLVEVLECAPAENDTFVTAANLAGRRPGDYSAKLDVRLDPSSPADVASKIVFRELLEIMRCNENGIRERIDTEFLHDFRVAVRRTRSALTQMKRVFPEYMVERYLRDFRWLQQITGVARDMDVYLLHFDDFEDLVDPSLGHALEPLRDFIGQKREFAYQGLVRSLDSARYRNLVEDWRAFIDQRSADSSNSNVATRKTAEIARKRIWRLYRRAIKEGRGIKPSSPSEDLHELRKTCKKLRYLLEFFNSLFPKRKAKKMIRPLKQLQDNLGKLNDMQVQSEVLKSFSKSISKTKPGEPETLMATGILIHALLAKKEAERARFSENFETFAQPAVDVLFRDVCRPSSSDRAP